MKYLYILVFGLLTGCAGQKNQLEEALEASRDIAVAAKPCLVAQQDYAETRCEGDAQCIETVRTSFDPIARAYELLEQLWCALAEEGSEAKEGCPR
jgi:hypothetical protein